MIYTDFWFFCVFSLFFPINFHFPPNSFTSCAPQWAKIGINFSSFQLSLSAILFHTSLALIFLLYSCFFVKLNMFQTVKYLAGIGLLAYLSGHSLLSGLIKRNAAAKGKQQ